MDNYPLGADEDPRAPWREVTPRDEEVEVCVSITMSKVFKIKVNDYESIEDYDAFGNICRFLDFGECDLLSSFKDQHFTPDQAYMYVKDKDNDVKQDLTDWNVDEIEVVLNQ